MTPNLLLFLMRLGLPPTRNRVMQIARFESRNLGHNFIGSEHILCALARLPDKRLRELFAQRDVGIEGFRSRVVAEDTLGPHRHSGAYRPMTPRLERILPIAEAEAARVKHLTVPQSLLLGMIIEGRGVGTRVLKSLGLDLRQLRNTLLGLPNEGASPNGGPAQPSGDSSLGGGPPSVS